VKVGKYEVESEVGRGGMGVVYRAHDASGRTVAVKVVRDKDGANTMARFERERRLANELVEDDGFVPLLDAGVCDEGPFLVMPYLRRGTLRERLGHAWTVGETLTLGRALARALVRAHAHGIVHRDLKPENILFTDDGRPLIADLGLAKHFKQDGGRSTVALTQIGHMVGTAGYMAPEQVTDSKGAGPAADVFALGLILHECLTGAPAFSGKNPADLLANIVECKRAPLEARRPDVPDELREILDTALAATVERRFKDGEAFARALTISWKEPRPGSGLAPILAVVALVAVVAFLAITGQRAPAKGTPDAAPVESSRGRPAIR
jgi:serine/threonine protein kinase